MATFKFGGTSALTLTEKITTPSIRLQKDGNNWYVPLFSGNKGSVVQNGDYNYTLGGLKVGNYHAAISREEADLFLIADNFYTFQNGVLNRTKSPTITKCNISNVGNFGLYYAFYGCTGLTGSISFPNLTSIGDNGLRAAFYSTGLTSVSFPKLTSIGEHGLYYAFYNCTRLKEVHFKSSLSGNYQCTASNMWCNATIYFDL